MIGTVMRVDRHGALVRLEEYRDLEAFVHISEVSLKWVRNIRDYLREGQTVVLKVIRSSPESMQVDASLRRVSERERSEKTLYWSQLQKVRRMLSTLMARTKVDYSVLEEGLLKPAAERHIDIYHIFEEVSTGEPFPEWVRLPDNVKQELVEMIRREIKRSVAVAKRLVKLYAGRAGVDAVRAAAEEAMRLGGRGERVAITVIGAPKYLLRVEAEDRVKAEQLLEAAFQAMRTRISAEGGVAELLEEAPKK